MCWCGVSTHVCVCLLEWHCCVPFSSILVFVGVVCWLVRCVCVCVRFRVALLCSFFFHFSVCRCSVLVSCVHACLCVFVRVALLCSFSSILVCVGVVCSCSVLMRCVRMFLLKWHYCVLFFSILVCSELVWCVHTCVCVC